ncbi:nucleotide exchange factor GrpE [Actinopolyspora mortivallis]|uniref:Protein GrpE n=1 Tax=Actinopolyspora mortivallis TaxID=33906 RepID=A0A2T0GUK1_ACTMO|nr:nucleotide exchange factor GrpE [Actinopolyspora mortivallis]PRW62780.1 nucleotide exchange factor GrpE [Actinopolyspora mortivallis]
MTANRPEEDRDAQRNPGTREEDEQEPVVVRDKRRIDPETGTPRSGEDDSEGARSGEVTDSMSGTLDDELAKVAAEADAVETAAEAAGAEAASSDAEAELRRQVDELTADVKRVQAEYANYRKRVERDRETVINNAKASVAESLLTVLDDLERAEAHGDLTGPFKAVSDKLTSALREAGLEGFGQEGEEFDPSVHEAVQHETSPEVSGPTVTTVLRRGYRFGDRVLRPAMVAVTDYEPAAEGDGDAVAADSQGETSEQG